MILDDSELCFGDLPYENRIVAFFDILGWKEEINSAGDDPRHIARLAAAVRFFASHVGLISTEGALISTFSDNVVFSKPFASTDVPWVLQSLATTQVGLGVFGFWVRGGVTIGPIHHDQHIVFGPALNRAYHLESKEAKFPRFLLDDTLSPYLPLNTDYLEVGEISFIDGFRPQFWDRIQSTVPIQDDAFRRFNELASTDIPRAEVTLPGHIALSNVLSRLSATMTSTDNPACWEKLAWLFDRVSSRIGSAIRAADLPKSTSLQWALGLKAGS